MSATLTDHEHSIKLCRSYGEPVEISRNSPVDPVSGLYNSTKETSRWKCFDISPALCYTVDNLITELAASSSLAAYRPAPLVSVSKGTGQAHGTRPVGYRRKQRCLPCLERRCADQDRGRGVSKTPFFLPRQVCPWRSPFGMSVTGRNGVSLPRRRFYCARGGSGWGRDAPTFLLATC